MANELIRQTDVLKPAMITRFCEVKVNTFEMTEEGKGRILNREMGSYKKEPNGGFRTGKYNI